MRVAEQIKAKLQADLSPEFLEIVDESHMHSGPPDAESHFKATIVAGAFDNVRKVARHQKVYQILKSEMDGSVHALALHTYTPEEWKQRNQASPDSPDCRGGSQLEA
jgi:BolA protein